MSFTANEDERQYLELDPLKRSQNSLSPSRTSRRDNGSMVTVDFDSQPHSRPISSNYMSELDPIEAFYQDVSLFCLRKKSVPRIWAIRMTLSPWFDKITMAVILLNCLTLGLYDPCDHNCVTVKCRILEVLENMIYVYFLLEMIVKILALGFLGSQGYLADTWNRLDFFIVAAGTFEQLYGDGEFLSSVRAVRVLRPLRAINRVPSIRILVTLLIDTLPMLGNVFVLCVLVLMVFAIIGVQLWQGLLRNRCELKLPDMPSNFSAPFNLSRYYTGEDEWSMICSYPKDNGQVTCPILIPEYELSNGTKCSLSYDQYSNRTFMSNFTNSYNSSCINWNQYYTECKPIGENPFQKAISFDHTGDAFIAIFQTITLEGWTDIMYFVQDAYSSWVWIYFVALIFIGSYFLTNLCLVVVATQFSETREREQGLIEAANNRSKKSVTSSIISSDTGDKGCYNTILSMLARYIRRAVRKLKRRICGPKSAKLNKKGKKKKQQRSKLKEPEIHFHHHHHHHIHHHHLHLCPNNSDKHHADVQQNMFSNVKAVVPTKDDSSQVDTENNIVNPIAVKQTALIIPDTTVVICHSSSLPNSVTAQSPMTTVALFPNALSNARPVIEKAGHDFPDYRKVADDLHNMKEQEVCEECERKIHDSKYHSMKPDDSSESESEDEDDDEEEEPKKRNCLKVLRERLKCICESNGFKVFIMTSIFVNTITMASEHYEQPDAMTDALDVFNMIFTAIFTVEFVMKLLGYGLYGYIKEAFNLFDGIVVIISLVEMSNTNKGGGGGGGVSVLRTFRLMRIFKLVRFLPALQKQIKIMLETLDSVMTFLGLLTIFIFTSAILGMHLFGAKMVMDDKRSVRHNFDNLMWSLITVFQVLTQEDWNAVLYDAMHFTTPWASVYFIMLMIIGNYVLFNLLVAILVEGFSTEADSKSEDDPAEVTPSRSMVCMEHGNEEDMFSEEDSIHANGAHYDASHLDVNKAPGMDQSYLDIDKSHLQSLPNISTAVLPAMEEDQTLILLPPTQYPRKKSYAPSYQATLLGPGKSASDSALYVTKDRPDIDPDSLKAPLRLNMDGEGIADEEPEQTCCGIQFFESRMKWTFFICAPSNRLRRSCKCLVVNPWFDNIILFFIFANCVVLAMERPSILPDSTERKVIDISNHVFTVVFTIEMLIKITALSLFFGNEAYLKNGWNILDFCLVIISLVDVVVTMTSNSKSGILGMLKVLRAFRTLRPLRLISRAPGLKVVVETLIQSLAPIGNLCIVGLVFFVIFGILGVQLFKGKFHYCHNASQKVTNRTECSLYGGTWKNKRNNFDNLPQAIMTLFVFATKDGWVSLMYDGIDAKGIDMEPERDYNPFAFTYFVLFLLIAGFVVINMVVGVIIDNFQKCQEQILGTMEPTEQEDNNSETDDIPADLDSFSKPRRMIFFFVSHFKFDMAIAAIIGVNVLFMAIEHYQQPQELSQFLRYMNFIFTAVFILESILKIIGFGPRLFFGQRWNQLDVIIVFLSIIGIVFEELDSSLPINPTIIRIMRVLRIARVLKILKAADGVQSLLNCVSDALPQVGNLSSLFLLIFFIFASLGIELFGNLDCDLDECQGLDRHAHFENFGYAMLTLFRISTGDNWSGVFKDSMNPKLCKTDCSMLKYVAPIYFAIFVLASQFVLVNVVVAVLMKQLEDSKNLAIMPSSLTSKLRSHASSENKLSTKERPSSWMSNSSKQNIPIRASYTSRSSYDVTQMTSIRDSHRFRSEQNIKYNEMTDSRPIIIVSDPGTRCSYVDVNGFTIRDYNLADSCLELKEKSKCEFCDEKLKVSASLDTFPSRKSSRSRKDVGSRDESRQLLQSSDSIDSVESDSVEFERRQTSDAERKNSTSRKPLDNPLVTDRDNLTNVTSVNNVISNPNRDINKTDKPNELDKPPKDSIKECQKFHDSSVDSGISDDKPDNKIKNKNSDDDERLLNNSTCSNAAFLDTEQEKSVTSDSSPPNSIDNAIDKSEPNMSIIAVDSGLPKEVTPVTTSSPEVTKPKITQTEVYTMQSPEKQIEAPMASVDSPSIPTASETSVENPSDSKVPTSPKSNPASPPMSPSRPRKVSGSHLARIFDIADSLDEVENAILNSPNRNLRR